MIIEAGNVAKTAKIYTITQSHNAPCANIRE